MRKVSLSWHLVCTRLTYLICLLQSALCFQCRPVKRCEQITRSNSWKQLTRNTLPGGTLTDIIECKIQVTFCD